MRIASIHLKAFKRFTDLTITEIPLSARLVIMAGPNGSGKSSIFDAFQYYRTSSFDGSYHVKHGMMDSFKCEINFHNHEKIDSANSFYIRTAHRDETDMHKVSIRNMKDLSTPLQRMKQIDNEQYVSDNYERIAAKITNMMYDEGYSGEFVRSIHEKALRGLREAVERLLPGLTLDGIGNPTQDGAFLFNKGSIRKFHYRNLSGGEKAAFDILLDLFVKSEMYPEAIFCIDEPELHIHTKTQGKLLNELMNFVPLEGQLWLATHSIGILKAAADMQRVNPEQVAFLNFNGYDFDQTVTMSPVHVNRKVWGQILGTALHDLASLVAPRQIVLCEGRPPKNKTDNRAEFDAQCYRKIFESEYLDTEFLSVGSAIDVQSDKVKIADTIQTLVSGTIIVRLIDRDDRSLQEIEDLRKEGVRVLSRRHLESYLLDDEILTILCQQQGKPDKVEEVLAAKKKELQDSISSRNNAPDDIKSIAGKVYTESKKILQLTQCGNTPDAFLRDVLAPLIKPGTKTYAALKADIFSE